MASKRNSCGLTKLCHNKKPRCSQGLSLVPNIPPLFGHFTDFALNYMYLSTSMEITFLFFLSPISGPFTLSCQEILPSIKGFWEIGMNADQRPSNNVSLCVNAQRAWTDDSPCHLYFSTRPLNELKNRTTTGDNRTIYTCKKQNQMVKMFLIRFLPEEPSRRVSSLMSERWRVWSRCAPSRFWVPRPPN